MKRSKVKSTDLTEIVEKIAADWEKERENFSFSAFLTQKFAGEGSEELSEEEKRKKAWKNFKKTEKEKTDSGISGKCLDISEKTKRKWFEIGGVTVPKREQIIKLAYEFMMSPNEAELYLKKGLGLTGFQYNHYKEFLYLYGLERNISFWKIKDMISSFEAHMDKDLILAQNTHTNWLKGKYMENVTLEPEDFLDWMCENAGVFKGYSRTTLHYLEKYLDEINLLLHREERKELEWLLGETDYEEYREKWLRKYPKETEEGEDEFELAMIRRYIRYASRKKERLPAELCTDILHTARLAYGGENRHNVIANLFSLQKEEESRKLPFRRLTDSRLSMLLHISEIKEKEIRQSLREGKSEQSFYVEREDLLLLIHYVSEVRYYEIVGEKGYSQADAIQYFKDRADSVLQACGMETVSGEFALDYLLLSCFGREEMYQISDVIEFL